VTECSIPQTSVPIVGQIQPPCVLSSRRQQRIEQL
ncbi:hypothetical protein LSAT2_004418, partial [Lamellibrachia satsuma]